MDFLKLPLLGLIALIAAYAVDQGHDLAFRVHGTLIFLVSAGLFIRELRRTGEPRTMVVRP